MVIKVATTSNLLKKQFFSQYINAYCQPIPAKTALVHNDVLITGGY